MALSHSEELMMLRFLRYLSCILLTACFQAKSQGLEIDARDHNQQTPLMLAAAQGHRAIVDLLLKAGATINAQDSNGATPLILAALNNQNAVALLLVERAALLDIQDKDKKTALIHASQKGYEKIVKILIEAGANIFIQDSQELKALSYALAHNHEKIAEILFQAAAEKNAPQRQLHLNTLRKPWESMTFKSLKAWGSGGVALMVIALGVIWHVNNINQQGNARPA
jgi:hypothetical protein